MRNRLQLLTIVALLLIAPVIASAQGAKSGIAVVPTGTDSQGRRLYTVMADKADITALLKELFRISGDQYTVDRDVAGSVDLKLNDATIEQVFREVVKLARPPIKLARQGSNFRVSREFNAQAAANAIRERAGESILQGMRPQASGFGPTGNPYQSLLPANRPVTLDVPREHPITLVDALGRISAQTSIPVRLDRRIPRDVTFSGTLSLAPLGLVLQYIAEASDLKVLWENTQVLLVPTDRFQLRVNEIVIGEHPAVNCPKCGNRMFSEWLYCPRCGQAATRAGIVPIRPGPARMAPNRLRNQKNPE